MGRGFITLGGRRSPFVADRRGWEDFIEGSLSWGPAAYDVYFEYRSGIFSFPVRPNRRFGKWPAR